jgi:hypothetical protein
MSIPTELSPAGSAAPDFMLPSTPSETVLLRALQAGRNARCLSSIKTE